MRTLNLCVRLSCMFALVLLTVFLLQSRIAVGQSPQAENLHGEASDAPHHRTNPTPISAVEKGYGKLPTSFEQNLGQSDPQVNYVARGSGYDLFLTNFGFVASLQEASRGMGPLKLPGSLKGDFLRGRGKRIGFNQAVLRLDFRDADPRAGITGEGELVGKVNYFIGNNPANWRTGIKTFSRVRYSQLYPGVDLVFYGSAGRLEYDLVVAPGARTDQIAFAISGSRALRIDRQGNIRIHVPGGEVQLEKPLIYQKDQGKHHVIEGRYVVGPNHTVKLEVGAYDRQKELIIDPVLDYSTYVGGTSADSSFGIATDSSGNAYITGQTSSTDFPVTTGAIQSANRATGGGTVFVTEINSTGTAVLYSTYLGGTTSETGLRIALDTASPANVYVTGLTCSTDFPTTSNAYLQSLTPAACTSSSGGAGFATKFNPTVSGSAGLVYSTYLGGNGGTNAGGDSGEAIAVDSSGNIYVAGATYSTNFPTTSNAFQTTNPGGGTREAAFLTRIDPTKSGVASLIYSTYLGGPNSSSFGDIAYGVAVDSNSNAYLVGGATAVNFPTTANGFSETFPSGSTGPAFVSRIDTTASGSSSLVYSTFLGGSTNDAAFDIALSQNGLAYITGFTLSTDFPVTTGAYQTTSSLSNVAFLSVIDTTKSEAASLAYSTYLGGSQGKTDVGNAVKVDSAGNAYIVGYTFSPDFPVTSGAYQTSFSGCASGFVTELMPLGNGASDLAYSTFFDGNEPASSCTNTTFGASDVALDNNNNVYVTGQTAATNFPVLPVNAFQTSLKGTSDGYVAKFTLSPTAPSPTITSLSASSGVSGAQITITGTNFNMNQGSGNVLFGSVTAFIDSWSSTSILALVPVEGSAGTVQVKVQTANGSSNTKPFSVLPSINILTPGSGPVGSSVSISGYNFGSSGSVTFNGVSATTTSWNSSTIVATVPSTATTGNVIVTSNSLSSPGVSFTVVPTPNISSISVNNGTAGTSVTVTGTNFGSSQVAESGTVVFSGANAFISSWSSTSIVALVPSTALPGAGSVYVTASGVQSNSQTFTVNPTIGSLSPSAGPVGQTIVVTGADFGSTQGSGNVKFGGTTAVVNSWSPTSISAVVPSLTAGAVSLTVTAGSVTTSSLWFTVTGASGSAPQPNPPIPGIPPFASFGGGPEQIDLGNLNVHYDLPVLSKRGRGTPFSYTLKYDSSIWYPSGAPGSVSWQPVTNWGWAGQSSVVFGVVSYALPVSGTCGGNGYTVYYGWSYQDKFGVAHPINMQGVSTNASCGQTSQTGTATDGSGYTLTVSAGGGTLTATVTSKTGRQFNPPINSTGGAATFTDRNGNQISVNSSGVFTDTLGTTVLTVSGSAPNPLKFGYTPPAGGTVYVQVTYRTYSIQTHFACSGVAEYSNSSVPLVDRVTYPDGTFYQFQYELTPGSNTTYTGRVASVTLPTGGTISYTYQGGSNGINCADGSTAGFKRYTPDTGGSSFWNYARTPGSGAASTTTVTDPTSQANVTVIQFQGIYETQRQSYQGSSTLLRTKTTCYNGNTSNCTSTAVGLPILQRNVTTQLAGANNLTAGQVYRYDSNQNLLEEDDYDYGSAASGNPLKKTVVTYAALGNNITGFPQQATVTDGGGALVSKTTYNYDQGSVVATSGTPQHVAITGSRGNLTSTTTYTTASTFLTKSFTYFDTGNVQTATDVNTAQTTYTYGACGNSFATNVSEPLSLSRSMTWNCTGGVQTSATDENGKVWSTSYTNAFFWRPDSNTDPTNAVTGLTYTGATQVESVLPIVTGSSASDTLATLDSLGRSHLGQIRQSPGGTTFDTKETDYDVEGRPSRITLPFAATAGQGSSTAPGKTTTYDALGRVLQITDGGNGYTANSYSQNDVLVTRGPAPVGQNTEKHQYEYDGLGRLTSACEITNATGSGTCAQNSPLNGYWTKYSYDGASRLTGVTQNAQSSGSTQTRSYTYDFLGRTTSARDPETGNLTYAYTYDTDTTCGTSNGDLVKKVDPVGNVTCYSYDALHRQTSITYPSGSYASKTANKYFVYDAASVNGFTASNVKGRLAEAYTCMTSCGASSAPAHVQSASADCTGTSCSKAFSAANTSGNLIVVAVRVGITSPTVTVSDTLHNTYNLAGSQVQSTDGHKDYVYYAMNIAAGTNTITVNISSTATIRIAIHEYSGIATSTALDVTSGGQGTGTIVSSGNVTTTDVRELVFGVGSSANADSWSAGSGFTLRQTPANKLATEDQVITTTQTLAASFSISASDKWASIVVTFRAASAGTTDIGFSYTSRGEPSDVYESTPHSGGYYHVAEQFWANGAARQVTGLASLPTFTFNVDGEGRTYQVSASSGQNPVTNTVFNNASFPTSITFGSTDTDSFTYDPNTNRMTQYQFTVNGSSLTGTLTWNANATVHGLNITDALNSADNQSCSFLYDDLARLASTDCGTVWSQTYSYDAFGNIKKSGNAAFQPTYDAATNHITSVSGFNPTYDNNGNTLTDPSHTYSWDSAGKPVGIDSVSMTYDALGRMVEQNRSGAYTQFVYGPHGRKFAIFTGQSLQKAFVPLPGGTQAVYNASGILYYGHSDHLGSIRLGSTSSRTVSFDVAYAPFGETYAASGSTDPAFTGQRQDTVSGFYDFPAREYNSQGRWSSPDPLGLGSLNPTDPQTLNRYVYARNTPTSLVDPFGMESCDESSDPDVCGDPFGGFTGGGGGGDGISGQTPSDPQNPYANCPPDDPLCGAQPGSINPGDLPPSLGTPNSTGPGPGDRFSNVVDAGMIASAYAYWQSVNDPQHSEWSGEIYQNPDGTYSFNAGRVGDGNTAGFCPDCIPDGTDLVAGYHTHGVLTSADDLNAEFSPGDSDLIRAAGANPSYPKWIGGFLSSGFQGTGQVVYLGPQGAAGYIAPGFQPPVVICSSCVGPNP